MSPAAFARCQAFEPRASRGLATLLIALHALAAVAVLAAQIPWLWKPSALALVALSLHRALMLHAWRTAPGAVVRLTPRDDGRWVVQRRDGRVVVGALHGDSYIHPRLVVVGVRDGWRTLFVPVPADALDDDAHRRLRVLVKWMPGGSGAVHRGSGAAHRGSGAAHHEQR